MPPARQSPSIARVPVAKETPTPTLLNIAYTRLRALASGLEHACGQKTVCALHEWMTSYGSRLQSMADHLQDEGAKRRASVAESAAKLFLEDTCADSPTLLKEVELVQGQLLEAYRQLSMRLDMDEELYEQICEQEKELADVQEEIAELRREYETYGEG